MLVKINVQGIPRVYTASLANTPSASQLFTRLQYGSTVDGEKYSIDKDIKAIRAITNITLYPVDKEAQVIINRKSYKLPTIQANTKGFWYLQADYSSEQFTEAAKRELESTIKDDVDGFIAQNFEVVREQALQRYKEALHKTADYILLQVQAMKDYVSKAV